MEDTQSLRLDPDYASALIAQAAQIGAQGSAAGAASPANAIGEAGVSPIDTAVAAFDNAGSASKAVWSAALAAEAVARAIGGEQGVTALAQTEEKNAVWLHEVGPGDETAAVTV